jgi:hypothetical protein
MIVWPCIVTDSLWIKSKHAMNSVIGITTLHVLGSLSAHHQEFLAIHQLWYILCSCDAPFATSSILLLVANGSSQLHKMNQSQCTAKNTWWAERLPETCRVVILIKLEFSASVGFIHKESSMASFNLRFWSRWGRAFGSNVQEKEKKTTGFSTMTTRPLTHHSFDNSWLPKILVIPHTPYSPDLTSCDFFLFTKMKLQLKGHCFDMTKEIHTKTQEVINTLTFENFQGCMKSWETCWDQCRCGQGDYFEGDGGN